NRGRHFYLAKFWAQELSRQSDDAELAAAFAAVSGALDSAEETILGELLAVQGSPVDLGGYYHPDEAKVTAAMRPSAKFSDVLSMLG
ncbi:MAG: NADP-dependent isocitrate dehydrogenase, partial [Arthrobacter sp.]|nr:NADP-dependent isocitrate dehydrogenase [Arthrobacter sp.]